jgi:hypothetical protein
MPRIIFLSLLACTGARGRRVLASVDGEILFEVDPRPAWLAAARRH